MTALKARLLPHQTLEFSAVEVNYRNNDVKISGTRSLNGITEVLDMGGFVSSTKESVMKKVFTDEGEYEITIMAEADRLRPMPWSP